MPELPDVQGFVNYFNHTALDKKIAMVSCNDEDLIKNTRCPDLQQALHHQQFRQASRRGKYLIAEFKKAPHVLVFHFGMTGNLIFGEKLSPNEMKYARLVIEFEDHSQLIFKDVRQFGKIWLAKNPLEINALKKMGPEPLNLSHKEFSELLAKHQQQNIKSFLMDQEIIAGIGNEYSNELLFQSTIDPHQKIKDIDEEKRSKLYSDMQTILAKAIEICKKNKDARKKDLPEDWLLFHQKEMKCPKNPNHKLKRETIAGRSAIFCPQHQR